MGDTMQEVEYKRGVRMCCVVRLLSYVSQSEGGKHWQSVFVD